jgi:Hint domain
MALGNGMATYQITFFALPPDGATGLLAVPEGPDLRLARAADAAAVLLAETGAAGLVVSPGSPSGQAGQLVTLGARIQSTCAAGTGIPCSLRLLELDGGAVGLVAEDAATGALVDGAKAPVLQAGAIDMTGGSEAPIVPAMDVAALAGPATGKPRKSPFAFALGTRIDTPDGPRPVEALRPGDLISTLDNGSQPLRWIGRRWVSPPEMALREDLRPLRLEAGVLGNDRALLISPRHRVLLNDWRAQVYFGEDQVLVPAQALLNGATVRQVVPLAGVTYLHLLFDRHEVILSEGALSESLHLGETGLGALDPAQRQELEALFPDQALERRRAAFPTLRMAEARALRLPG